MSLKIDNALAKLNSVLPLLANQKKLPPQVKQLHQKLLQGFIKKGQILPLDEIKNNINGADSAIQNLAKLDMITLDSDGTINGVYPFSCQQREHKIEVNGFTLNAMCAMDALAISCMFKLKTTIYSQCRVSQTPITIQQNNKNTLCNLDAIYFAINWGASNSTQSCSESLCMDMIFLKDADIAKKWLNAEPESREIFTLNEAIEFADRFFSPLLN